MRIKIQHKKQIAFDDTVAGLRKLLEKAEELKIPQDAQVYFRTSRTAEFMWSSLDDNQIRRSS